MNPAVDRGLRKAGRTGIQMAAAGTLTVLVTALAHGLAPGTEALVLAVWGVVVAFLHNYLETQGIIPAILPAAGLITTTAGGAIGKVVGTVDAVTGTKLTTTVGDAVTSTTEVGGQVVDTAGKTVGTLVGTVGTILGGGLNPPPS